MGEGEHLGEFSGRIGDGIPGSGIDVDGIDPPIPTDDPTECDRHIAEPGSDIDAGPAGPDSKAVQGGGKRPPIDVVAQVTHVSKDLVGHALIVAHRRLGSGVTWSPESAGLMVSIVKVTMMLADSAQVADGKLYILGGGWSLMGPEMVPSALVIKLDLDWHETDRTFHWEIFLEDADGGPVLFEGPEGLEAIEIRGELSAARPEGAMEGITVDVPMAINMSAMPLQPSARYSWKLLIDGAPIEGGVIGFSTRSV